MEVLGRTTRRVEALRMDMLRKMRHGHNQGLFGDLAGGLHMRPTSDPNCQIIRLCHFLLLHILKK